MEARTGTSLHDLSEQDDSQSRKPETGASLQSGKLTPLCTDFKLIEAIDGTGIKTKSNEEEIASTSGGLGEDRSPQFRRIY